MIFVPIEVGPKPVRWTMLFKRALSLSIAATMIASSLAACGRAMHATDAAGNTQETVHAATLNQLVKSTAFSVDPADSTVTVTMDASGDGDMEFKGSAVVEKKKYAFDLKGRFGSGQSAVLYADEKINVTKDLLTYINKRYEGLK